MTFFMTAQLALQHSIFKKWSLRNITIFVFTSIFLLIVTFRALRWWELLHLPVEPDTRSSVHQRADRCKILGNDVLRKQRPSHGKCPNAGTPLRIAIVTVIIFNKGAYKDHVKRLEQYANRWKYDLHVIDNEAVQKLNLMRPPPPKIGKKRGRTVKWYKVSALKKFLSKESGLDYVYWTDIDNLLMDFSRPLESFIDEQQEVGLFLQEKNHQWPRMYNNHAFILKADDFGRDYVSKWFENSRHGEPCLPDQMTMFGTTAEYLSKFVKGPASYEKCWNKLLNSCHGYNLCFNNWMVRHGFGPRKRNADTKIFFYEDSPDKVRLSHNRKHVGRRRRRRTDCKAARGAFSVHAVKERGHRKFPFPFPCRI